MLTLTDISLLGFLVLGISYWWQARGYKTLALEYAWQRCQQLELQLLDQSVVLRKMRLRRGRNGSLQWQRTYEFEFASTGEQRYRGSVVLDGSRLLRLDLDVHVTQ